MAAPTCVVSDAATKTQNVCYPRPQAFYPPSPGPTLATPSCPLRALHLLERSAAGARGLGRGSLSRTSIHRQGCSVTHSQAAGIWVISVTVMSVGGGAFLFLRECVGFSSTLGVPGDAAGRGRRSAPGSTGARPLSERCPPPTPQVYPPGEPGCCYHPAMVPPAGAAPSQSRPPRAPANIQARGQ